MDLSEERLLALLRQMMRIREFDERGGWSLQGALSCAHWLNWRIGLQLGAAREKVRVARALSRCSSVLNFISTRPLSSRVT